MPHVFAACSCRMSLLHARVLLCVSCWPLHQRCRGEWCPLGHQDTLVSCCAYLKIHSCLAALLWCTSISSCVLMRSFGLPTDSAFPRSSAPDLALRAWPPTQQCNKCHKHHAHTEDMHSQGGHAPQQTHAPVKKPSPAPSHATAPAPAPAVLSLPLRCPVATAC